MLRACHRVLKPGGRIGYYNIFIAEHLPAARRRALDKEGFAETYTPARQQGLLRSAGFTNIRETDVTAEYLRIVRAFEVAYKRHERSRRRSLGAKLFDERKRRRERTIAGLEAGEIRRSLFLAERPARRA